VQASDSERIAEKVADRLVQEMQMRHIALYNLMDKFDVDHDGRLNKAELASGLDRLGMSLTADELDALMQMCDSNHDGSIEYDELYIAVARLHPDSTPNMKDPRRFGLHPDEAATHWKPSPDVIAAVDLRNEAIVHEVLDRLIGELVGKHLSVHDLLGALDQNSDGSIDRAELSGGIARMGINMSDEELDSLLRLFDKDRNGRIGYVEFHTVLVKYKVEHYGLPLPPIQSLDPVHFNPL
jgi:Ca2+-binding EF-hand superfamily protein